MPCQTASKRARLDAVAGGRGFAPRHSQAIHDSTRAEPRCDAPSDQCSPRAMPPLRQRGHRPAMEAPDRRAHRTQHAVPARRNARTAGRLQAVCHARLRNACQFRIERTNGPSLQNHACRNAKSASKERPNGQFCRRCAPDGRRRWTKPLVARSARPLRALSPSFQHSFNANLALSRRSADRRQARGIRSAGERPDASQPPPLACRMAPGRRPWPERTPAARGRRPPAAPRPPQRPRGRRLRTRPRANARKRGPMDQPPNPA